MNTQHEPINPSNPNYHQSGMAFAEWGASIPDQPVELTLQFAVCDTLPFGYRFRKVDAPMVDDQGRPHIVVHVELYDILRDRLVDSFTTGCNKQPDEVWSETAMAAIFQGPLFGTLADLQADEMERLFKFSLFNADKFLAENTAMPAEATWRFISGEVGLAAFIECLHQMRDEGLMTPDIEDMSFNLIREIMEVQSKVWEDDAL